MKRLLAYLLLLAFATVLVPRELWHHCEVHAHECHATGTHIDDISYHSSCEVCDFKLVSSEPLAWNAAFSILYSGNTFADPLPSFHHAQRGAVTTLRGPPVTA